MTSHQPSVHTPNQARDEQRRDEARKEELERKNLEDELLDFDSHGFYEKLDLWGTRAVPLPVKRYQQISWLKKTPNEFQPIPVSRAEFPLLHALAMCASRLLVLLKSAEQRGLGCPYVHQTNKETLERAINKCKEIQRAIARFQSSSGAVARLLSLLHKGYIFVLSQEVERFLSRLEAIFLICRHEEFAQDLVRLRRAVTYRTGYVLGPEGSEIPVPPKKKI